MGKNGHRKQRQRPTSDDKNGNTNFCNNNNNIKNGHNHLNGKKDVKNGHGNKPAESSLKEESIIRTSVKYIGYSLVLLLFLSLFIPEGFINVLQKSNQPTTTAESQQSDPQPAKIPGRVECYVI